MSVSDSARNSARSMSSQNEIELSNGQLTATVLALITDFTEEYDNDGAVVNARRGHLLVHEDVLSEAGFTNKIHGHIAIYKGKKYKVKQLMPNRTTGLLPCDLNDYVSA